MIKIKPGSLYYTEQGYVIVAEELYIGQDKKERVSFKYLADPESRYDCYVDSAAKSWIPMETWHKAEAKWELK